jgi:hypothetical protein
MLAGRRGAGMPRATWLEQRSSGVLMACGGHDWGNAELVMNGVSFCQAPYYPVFPEISPRHQFIPRNPVKLSYLVRLRRSLFGVPTHDHGGEYETLLNTDPG